MLGAFIRFYLTLLRDNLSRQPAPPVKPDPNHYHRRRFTAKYRRKQGIVKSLWISSGVVMLCFPVAPFVMGLGLFTTFLSFVILDETP